MVTILSCIENIDNFSFLFSQKMGIFVVEKSISCTGISNLF